MPDLVPWQIPFCRPEHVRRMQVLLTGARTATLLQRLPYLPAADAYVAENGGRIFYPDQTLPTAMPLMEDSKWRKLHNAAGACKAPFSVQAWGITPQNVKIVPKVLTAIGATFSPFLGGSHRRLWSMTRVWRRSFRILHSAAGARRAYSGGNQGLWSVPSSAAQVMTLPS